MEEEVEEKQSTCNNYMDVLNDFQLLTACALFFCCLYVCLFFVVVFVLFCFFQIPIYGYRHPTLIDRRSE